MLYFQNIPVDVLNIAMVPKMVPGKGIWGVGRGQGYSTKFYNVQFQKKIHTHSMEGHWKFLGGGGS